MPYGVDEEAVGKIETFVLNEKAFYAAETYVVGLFQLYPTVYFHKATRSAEKIFSELLARIVTLVQDGSGKLTGLPQKHPLYKFARRPDKIDNLRALDDTVIWGSLGLLSGNAEKDKRDKVVSSFAARLRDRKLLKSTNIRAMVRDKISHDAPETEVDRICKLVSDSIHSWSADHTGSIPRIILDAAEREPYKDLQADKGPLNQIRIRQGEEHVDLKERSDVVKAISTFKLLRAYYSEDDAEAKKFVEDTVTQEARNEG